MLKEPMTRSPLCMELTSSAALRTLVRVGGCDVARAWVRTRQVISLTAPGTKIAVLLFPGDDLATGQTGRSVGIL